MFHTDKTPDTDSGVALLRRGWGARFPFPSKKASAQESHSCKLCRHVCCDSMVCLPKPPHAPALQLFESVPTLPVRESAGGALADPSVCEES